MKTTEGEWTKNIPYPAYREQKCKLCCSLNDYKSTLLSDKDWENHDHKCVKCGWRIEDISDGRLITYDQRLELYLPKERYLNGYWEHHSCTSHKYKQHICPYCAMKIDEKIQDHYCDYG